VKVTSPVGDYEYVVRSVRLDGGRIVVAGNLGVWDTTMEIEPGDWLKLVRRIARPAAAIAAGALILRAARH
jgi:hypothetical protein